MLTRPCARPSAPSAGIEPAPDLSFPSAHLLPPGHPGALGRTLAVWFAVILLASATVPAEPGLRWACGAGECRAGFVLHTFWHDVEGSTSAVTALLESVSGDPLADGVITVTVEAASLGTGIDKRDRKMREEHLETAGHPLIEFRSTSPPRRLDVPAGGSGSGAAGAGGGPGAAHRIEITGVLTLHGVTKSLSLPLEMHEERNGWVATGRFKVRPSEFGIPDPSVLLNKVDDEVDAWFEVRLTPHPSP